jgi:hypothetical protein
MKHVKLIKRICESFLFLLMGNLIRIAFSAQLNYIDNIFLIICVVIFVVYVLIIRNIEEINKYET